ncbi:MAG: putative dehydrogenase [Kiritimatiellia bacterium]|jgi:predicted dehydrogenase
MKANRRSFLKTTAIAGAGPFILPSHIWSAETKPNDRINMGFIGMGKQNGGLMNNFMGQGTQVVAVCDVDTTRREGAQKRASEWYAQRPDKGSADIAAYGDFRELIARDDIDAVCVATPDHWHAYITIAALAAGKDVYCEKPLTHNIHESKSVIAAVEKYKRVLQTGSMQRSSKEFRVAAELVQNGVIGKVSHVECSFGDPGKPNDLKEEEMEPGLNWDMWCGPGPLATYSSVLSPRGIHNHFPSWRNYKEYGGGMVCDWGAHHLDIAQWGLGMDDSGPVETIPVAAGQKRGVKLKYASGITVEHKDGFGVHFYGSEGEVKVNRGRFELVRNGETFAKFTKREDGGSLGGALAQSEKEFLADKKIALYDSNKRGHVGDFLNSMETREKPITNEIVGGRTAICCHLMNQTYYENTGIKWNPAKNDFASGGNPAWLTRSYRGSWKV